MRGANEFHFNKATMIEALQLYLKVIFKDGEVPEVTGIKTNTNGDTFIIETDKKEKTEK